MVHTILLMLLATTIMAGTAVLAPGFHAGAAALAGGALALTAVLENRLLMARSARKSLVAAATARHLGSVWAWAALSLFLLEQLGAVAWPVWWQYCLGFAALAAVSFGFAARSAQDGAQGREDWSMLTLARRLTQLQLAGMAVALAVLITSGEAACLADIQAGCENWAAKNVFLFGELALAIVSANALWTSRHIKPSAAAYASR